MTNILQLSRTLIERPSPVPVDGVAVRHYRPGDVDRWLTLREVSFARQKVGVRAWSRDDFTAEFEGRIGWQPECLWIAEVDATGEFAGSVALTWRGEAPAVHWLMVAPKWRRRGVAQLLTQSLEAAVWDLGKRRVVLETHSGWRNATEFYLAMGYVAVTGETAGKPRR